MFEYRRADVKDINELVKMRLEFMKEVGKIVSSEKDKEIEHAMLEYFNKAMTNNQFMAWLALDDEKIIGTSGLCFYEVPPSFKNPTGKVAYIMNMYTKPEFRGKGIATNLFGNILDEAKKQGDRRITLNATNMGKPLYTKFGFIDMEGDMVYQGK